MTDKMKISRKDAKRLIKEAKRLGNGGAPSEKGMGICRNLSYAIPKASGMPGYKIVDYYAPKWKHFSGDESFPVPGGDYDGEPLWRKNKYGKRRRQLARFIAKCMRRDLGDLKHLVLE